MDYYIRKFRADLVNMINDSVLPIEVKRMVLQGVLHEVEEEANRVISMQIEQLNAEKEEIEKSEEEESEEQ